MFYTVEATDHIRVPPKYFDKGVKESVLSSIKNKYEGYVDQRVGIVVAVTDVKDIGEGVIIPGDGAAYYLTNFSLIAFRPELQEVVLGRVKDIADFGAFLSMGPIEGMIHVSQAMDDFVSFGKEKVLQGRDSKRSLRVGDLCQARVIAVSFKDISNPKIGLTMRQQGLGKLEWLSEPVVATATVKEKKK